MRSPRSRAPAAAVPCTCHAAPLTCLEPRSRCGRAAAWAVLISMHRRTGAPSSHCVRYSHSHCVRYETRHSVRLSARQLYDGAASGLPAGSRLAVRTCSWARRGHACRSAAAARACRAAGITADVAPLAGDRVCNRMGCQPRAATGRTRCRMPAPVFPRATKRLASTPRTSRNLTPPPLVTFCTTRSA